MPSMSAPTPMPVGFSNVDNTTPAPYATVAGALAQDELSFARSVRSPWWKSAWPLLTSVLFGAALLVTAGNAPPTSTVQRMLHDEQQQNRSAELRPTADYELPPQWQWPTLSGMPGGDSRLACDPARSVTAC